MGDYMEMHKKQKAALYIRVSTEEQAQDGQSPSAQLEVLKQYCCAYDIEVYDVYMDLGLSGKSFTERRELGRLLEGCRKREFDIVLVWKISRLSRNLKDLLYFIDIFESHNVHFASCSEKFDTSTPVGRMTLQLLGSIAEFERNTIVENVKLGLDEYARQGGKASSVLGYDNLDKKLAVNAEEAKIVKLIFHLYTENKMSFSAIAKHLNNLGLKTKRGCDFRSSSISYIINNPVYIGINRHSMNTEKEYNIQSDHPSIIDSEIWDKAQNMKRSLKGRPAKVTNDADAFASQIKCMKCGLQMKIFYAYSKGKKYKYFRCHVCSNYVNAARIKEEVSKVIIEIINDSSKWDTVLSRVFRKDSPINLRSMEISSLESEIKRLQKSKERYLALFENYRISDTKVFLDRMGEIESMIDALKEKKLELCRSEVDYNITETPEDYISELKKRLALLDPTALKQMSFLIKGIEAYKTDIKVHF